MRSTPPVAHVRWPDARRIVPSRHPPIDLFEDIADPQDWELLVSAEAKTNPRVARSVGRLDLVPAPRRVAGPGASVLMAPFVHVSAERPGRFHDGTFGAWYAANRFETAVAETAFHSAAFYRATAEAPGWLVQMRELVATVDHRFHDLRRTRAHRNCLDPTSYEASQQLASRLRDDASDGIVYRAVRDPSGQALAVFWPDVVGLPVQARHLAYHFDGARIDYVRNEADGSVWRLVPEH
jgi:hypothetical protein